MNIETDIKTTLLNYSNKSRLEGHNRISNYLNSLISNASNMSYFSSVGVLNEGNYEVTLKVLGLVDTTITIEYGDKSESINIFKDKTISRTLFSNDRNLKDYIIYGLENIKELDISNNNVEHLYIGSNNLNKLVVYNNKLTELDLSHCKELQFLHMFNNPICSDFDKMKDIIRQLPDRNEKSFGSIILYDWVNLGACGYRNSEDGLFYYDTEYKYPFGEALLQYNNTIFRDLNSIEHPWYELKDGVYAELEDYNNLIMLRRKLEGLDTNTWTYTNKDGSIFKNWVFGSAIQYNEEAWKYCDLPFRNAHIADVWETAEKGEGVGITSEDTIRFNSFNINLGRVKPYSHYGYPEECPSSTNDLDITEGNVGVAPIPVYENEDDIPQSIKDIYPWIEPGCYMLREGTGTELFYPPTNKTYICASSHGDNCFSFMGSRGVNGEHKDIYGISPESRYYLRDRSSNVIGGNKPMVNENDYRRLISKAVPIDSSKITIEGLTSPSSNYDSINMHDINVMSRSLGHFFTMTELNEIEQQQYDFRAQICNEIFKSMSGFNANGNSGDGIHFTTDQGVVIGSIEDNAQLGNYEMGEGCNWVGSLNRNKEPSVFSSSDRSDKSFNYSYVCYGESVRVWTPETHSITAGDGTSYATPLHSAETALLRVLYSKLNNHYKYHTDTNYWYCINSPEIQTAFKHYADKYLDILPQFGRGVVGMGTIDMLQYNSYSVQDTNKTYTLMEDITNVGDTNELIQVTKQSTQSLINQGHYAYSDINRMIFSNKEHTQFIPLKEGEHNITIYNNHRNVIDDSDTIFGITDDTSENKWWSQKTITSNGSMSKTLVTENLIYDNSSISNGQTIDVITSNDDGWSLFFKLKYVRNTTGSPKTLLCDTEDFKLHTRKNSVSNREKIVLYIEENHCDMENDKGYTYLIADCYTNDTTKYRYRGYLGDVKDNDFILTVVKLPKIPVYEFYINGQYIISHKSSQVEDFCGTLEGLKILPTTDKDGTTYNNVHFNKCKRLCIYNKTLDNKDIVQQSLHMLSL